MYVWNRLFDDEVISFRFRIKIVFYVSCVKTDQWRLPTSVASFFKIRRQLGIENHPCMSFSCLLCTPTYVRLSVKHRDLPVMLESNLSSIPSLAYVSKRTSSTNGEKKKKKQLREIDKRMEEEISKIWLSYSRNLEREKKRKEIWFNIRRLPSGPGSSDCIMHHSVVPGVSSFPTILSLSWCKFIVTDLLLKFSSQVNRGGDRTPE